MNGAFWLFMALGALGWFSLVGQIGMTEALTGTAVVASAWAIFRRLSEFNVYVSPRQFVPWLTGVARYLIGYVSLDMIRSTFRVFKKVLAPSLDLRPAILAIPLPGASRTALVLLAYGISLTPGQLIVAIDEANSTLYVHFLDAPDPEKAREELQDLYCRYLKEVKPW